MSSPTEEPVWWRGQPSAEDTAARLAHGRGNRALETLCFDGERYLRLERHLRRLHTTCVALGWMPPTPEHLSQELGRFAEHQSGPCLVRLTVGVERALTSRPLPSVPGEVAVWVDDQVTQLGAAGRFKTTSRLVYDLLAQRARAQGAFEGLFRGARGELWEGSVTNLFAVREGALWTAPVEAGVLPGVVREHVLEEARRIGVEVREEAPCVGDLDRVSELFLTSAGIGLLAVDRVFGMGEEPQILPVERPLSAALAQVLASS